MKNGLLILNVVLLAAVAVLFYLHFSTAKKTDLTRTAGVTTNAASSTSFRIAYFDMDSIANSFSMVKEVKSELSKREDAMNNELVRMEKEYRSKAAQYQAQAANMNQAQSEMAQRDMMQMQQAMQGRKQQMEQDYQEFQMRKQLDVRTKIEDFLKQYNQNNTYSYIVSYEPGLFYYKDTAYNITGDVIKGLNADYGKKK
jgi:outer membrane protein